MGGYTAGPSEVVQLLRQRARPYLFSNTLPPAVVGATSKVFDMLLNGTDLVAKVLSDGAMGLPPSHRPSKVQHNTILFRDLMTKAGFTVGGDPSHPICPIMIGDARLAADFADAMLKEGVYVIGFSYPVSHALRNGAANMVLTDCLQVVAKGKARIRTQISAAHSEEDVRFCVEAFTRVAKSTGFL
jgi:glycine C-acetyltransferase